MSSSIDGQSFLHIHYYHYLCHYHYYYHYFQTLYNPTNSNTYSRISVLLHRRTLLSHKTGDGCVDQWMRNVYAFRLAFVSSSACMLLYCSNSSFIHQYSCLVRDIHCSRRGFLFGDSVLSLRSVKDEGCPWLCPEATRE